MAASSPLVLKKLLIGRVESELSGDCEVHGGFLVVRLGQSQEKLTLFAGELFEDGARPFGGNVQMDSRIEGVLCAEEAALHL